MRMRVIRSLPVSRVPPPAVWRRHENVAIFKQTKTIITREQK